MIELPRRRRGHQSAGAKAEYAEQLGAFCQAILQIRSTLDFDVSARGWCYLLEEHGLTKGDFDKAQALIADCRKHGLLPLGIVAEDVAREFENVERIDFTSATEEAEDIIETAQSAYWNYTPMGFWEDQQYYLQMLVEKVDLKNLFGPICRKFHIPIANARGWSDLNSRANMMRRFAEHEGEGRQCVLLYCGDHDPAGLKISQTLRSNLEELADAVGWHPDDLTIDRFGLNYDFIEEQNLTWVDNLETGAGKRLDDPRHHDHKQPYVQDYLTEFGARKVEANALVARVAAGRELCRAAILKYVDDDAPHLYRAKLEPLREEVREEVLRLLQEGVE